MADNDVDNCTNVFDKSNSSIVLHYSLNEPVVYDASFYFIYYIEVDCCVTINLSKAEVDCCILSVCILGSLVNGPEGVISSCIWAFLSWEEGHCGLLKGLDHSIEC